MLTTHPESLSVDYSVCREPATRYISELTRSFVKGSLKTLLRLLESDSGALFLSDPSDGSLVLESLLGPADSSLKNARMPAGQPVLSIPICVSGEMFGLIKLGIRSDGVSFSKEDLRLVEVFCKYICRIVEDQIRFTKDRLAIGALEREKCGLEKYVSVGNLAAGIVGQINSPLDGALRYTGLMVSHPNDNERHRDYLIELQNGLRRIAGITASLSHMHNPSHKRSDCETIIDAHQMLDEAVDVFAPLFKGRVRFIRSYDGQMRIFTDTNIRHVFTNMIKNALEAMPQGGELEISSQIKQAGLQIVFRDTGSGIPSDHQDLIFEPFFTTKPVGAGNGFGLALCKDIVGRYGGRIAVKSAQGKGSAFTILFPKDIIA